MKLLTLVLLFSISVNAKYKSQVQGLDIENSHLVYQGAGKIYRGSQPVGKEAQLKNLGITDVIIFKNDTKGEVEKEKQSLLKLGYAESQIHIFPFLWNRNKKSDPAQFEIQQCEYTIDALEVMVQTAKTKDKALFFHCTVGEDRTGMLAGLFKLLVEKKDAKQVYLQEMCSKGYADGNPGKPIHVSGSIHSALTPLYYKMAVLIKNGEISTNKLDKQVCQNLKKTKAIMAVVQCPKIM